MSDLLERIEGLPPEKRELLRQRLKGKRKDAKPPQIARQPRDNNQFPLSFAQQRLWFLDQFEPNSAHYNLSAVCRLHGRLDVDALEQSFQTILNRHETLRTTFAAVDGQPVQIIGAVSKFKLPLVDLRNIPETEREPHALQLARDEGRRPFELAVGPLLRIKLLRLAPEKHFLLLTMHHIITDGWSTGILLRELSALYSAAIHQQDCPLPALSIQYVDFAAWQQQWLQGDVLEKQLSYWREQLNSIPTALALPTDHARPPIQTFCGDHQAFSLSPPLSAALKKLSQQEGATLFMTLLAAFQVLLYRYSQQDDIVVGTPIANRNRAEIEGLIGFFVNTLVMRSNLAGEPGFLELLAQVKNTALSAYAHQDLPFEKLVQELEPERDLSRTPLFQVMFVLQNMPRKPLDLSGVSVDFPKKGSQTAKVDLSMYLGEKDGQIKGSIEYNTDLFEAATIERLTQHFQILLEGIVADSTTPISVLPILASDEYQRVMAWNATDATYPQDMCLHQLFEVQAEQTPDAIAVICEAESLTYRELNARVNQLAYTLRTLGVGPEVLVGLCMERSVEMVIGLLGVLKAGGGYVPLDPAYPKERLAFMLEDAQARVLVTQQRLVEELPVHRAQVVCLDTDWNTIASERAESLVSAVTTEHVAYVIYTSGSTGKPKGVQIPHRAVVNFVHSMRQQPGLTAHDVLLAVTTLSFDIAVLELFLPLTVGARVVLVSREVAADGQRLGQSLADAEATVMQATPATWRLLLAAGWSGSAHLKMLCGGEALPSELSEQLLARGASLWNLYGPTETTIWSAVSKVAAQDGVVSIGRPIANTQIYLLDRRLQPVPIGAPGELYIGGAGVARGYLNRPELTAERFMLDPFSGAPGARMYRTGDVARYRPDGNLDFLGRVDDQVKVRGFRIELGEIEAVLSQYAGLYQAAVIVREDMPGEKQLVAYIVPDQQQEVERDDIRAFLKEKLPDYMIPAAYVTLDQLPLTPNGKIDRKAFPRPDHGDFRQSAMFVAPRNATEQTLVDIWAQVLGLEQVGIHDNFFDLGGHSLLATQVISRMDNAFGRTLPLRTLFEKPTVAGLATALLTQEPEQAPYSNLPPIQPGPRERDLPLSFAQQRLWFLDQLEPDSTAYNLSMAARLQGPLNFAALEHSFHTILSRHDTLRTTFAAVDGQPVQVIGAVSKFELPLVDLQNISEAERESHSRQLLQDEGRHPFDLAVGPLLRVTLLRLSPEEHFLLLTMHHIITDGWSTGILLRELSALYSAGISQQECRLPDLSVQYVDFAAWQQQWLQGDVLEKQLSYWREQLDSVPTTLALPTDHARPPIQTFRGDHQPFSLSPTLSADLKKLSQQQGATLFMTLLAAFQVILYRYAQQDDIVVGTPIANRNRSEIEGLIGLFVNTLVMRGNLAGEPSFLELLGQVKDTALSAYAHQDVPFEKLVQELEPERDLSRPPLFQVMFVLQNMPRHPLDLSGLQIDFPATGLQTAKVDLSMYLGERNGQIKGYIEYNTDLFVAATIERLVQHFQILLQGIVADPTTSISALPILGPAEYHQVTEQWNNTQADFTDQASIHQLFELQVERSPGAIALIDDVQQLTYRELNNRANQLAHFLQSKGLAATDLVGVCFERSAEMVVALLAVLKTGAAYVPLDPAYPRERLAFMLADAQVSLLLTSKGLSEVLPEHKTQTVHMDTQWETIVQTDESNLAVTTMPENPAYVLYTSGSTGTPKGVVGRHRGAVNRFAWMWEKYPFAPHEVCCQKTSLNFVDSVWEIFGPLLRGVSTVVIPNPLLTDPPLLVKFLAQHQVTRMVLVPSLLRVLLETYDDLQDRLPQLRHWICSGEALPLELCNRFQAVMPQSTLLNLYGSSEVAADVTCFDTRLMQPDASSVPIGRPIANIQLYVLDRHLRPVPKGVPAELYVGGAGLAQGYLNRPDLTEQRFIPNPFSGESGARLYKTGDIVRYRPDGNLEFLGRVDDQIKIRGFRIELGEIEAVLRQCPGLHQAAVIVREDIADGQQLVAYIEPHQQQTVERDDITTFLKERLPDYMIPAAYVEIDQLPLTPNGKLDREALPKPDYEDFGQATEFVEARNASEQTLVDIWIDVLGLEKVGIHHNFFDLGGHSLLATQVISRIEKAFEITLPLRTIFEKPTVAGLATALITQDLEEMDDSILAEILTELESSGEDEG